MAISCEDREWRTFFQSRAAAEIKAAETALDAGKEQAGAMIQLLEQKSRVEQENARLETTLPELQKAEERARETVTAAETALLGLRDQRKSFLEELGLPDNGEAFEELSRRCREKTDALLKAREETACCRRLREERLELQKRLEAVQRELAEKQQEESAGMGRLEALEDQIQAELELPGTEAGLKSGKAMENELEDLDAALSKIRAELEENRKKLLRREQLEKAAEETERLSGLVEDLLDFSRMQSGRLSVLKDKMDLIAELEEALYMYRARAEREQITLVCDFPDTLPPAFGDANRIKQVFVNIIDNGVKYSSPGGCVYVNAHQDADELVVSVRDEGCGIEPQDLPRVTEKFYRANKTRGGSGIGLAVADEIIRQHDGTLQLDSAVGVGTTVTIRLPVYHAETAETPDSPQ